MLILVKRTWGIRDILKSLEDPGRKKGKPVGSYVDDLAALHKAIVLCSGCRKGFHPKRHGYYQQRELPFVQGNCDACRAFSPNAFLFIYGEDVHKCWVTREDDARTRRKANIVGG